MPPPLRQPPTRVASGAPGPALGPALEALDGAGAGAALVVARLDRVTRSLLRGPSWWSVPGAAVGRSWWWPRASTCPPTAAS